MDDQNPFFPGIPVHPDFFFGRSDLIGSLNGEVEQVLSGRPRAGFISGERGIGKSSLADYVRAYAAREFRVFGVHAYLGGIPTVEGLVEKVFDQIAKDMAKRTWFDKVKDFFGKNLRSVDVFGISVEFRASDSLIRSAVRSFDTSLGELTRKLAAAGDHQGLLLILDDINGLATSPEFADWFKSLMDGLASSGDKAPIYTLLVGLPERRAALVKNQPSVGRIFKPFVVETFSTKESREFFKGSFARTKRQISKAALDTLVLFAGGHPMLAQEIGDRTYSRSKAGEKISEATATMGVLDAAESIGKRYLDEDVYNSLRSPSYRGILRILAQSDSPGFRFTRKQTLEALPTRHQKAFDRFLRRMRELGVIVPDKEHGRGAYRFSQLLHYLYFRMEAKRAANAK